MFFKRIAFTHQQKEHSSFVVCQVLDTMCPDLAYNFYEECFFDVALHAMCLKNMLGSTKGILQKPPVY